MTITVTGDDVSFETDAAAQAIARNTITTTDGDVAVSFSFEVTRNQLVLRVGTTAGGQEVVPDMTFDPGVYSITFTPGATTYYVEWKLETIGKAELKDFARVAAGTLAITAPWAYADLPDLRFQQSINVSWVAASGYQTRVIERRGDTSWGIRLFQPGDGPFEPLNASTTTLSSSARSGEVTITASGPIFATYDAGQLLKLTHAGQYEEVSATAVDDATDTVRVSGTETSRVFRYTVDFTSGTGVGTVLLERSVGNEVNWETAATITTDATNVSFDDELDNQIVYYRLRCSAYTSGTIAANITHSQGLTDGIARIVSVDADNAVTADVIEPFAKLNTATALWYWGSWGSRFGWPSAVGMYDGRLFMARSDEYWGSYSDNFESFAIGSSDADAVGRSFTGKLASARWLKGVAKMVAGTAGSEHVISSGELSEVITPSTVLSRQIHARGSMNADAVVIDNSVAFISRNKKRIYLLTGVDGGDSYNLVDLTRLHPSIGGTSGFKELFFQNEPWPRLWAIREDGEAAVLLLSGDEEVAAWARYKIEGGTINSGCCVSSTPEDDVYFSVNRTIDSSSVYYIEKLASEAFDTIDTAWRLQSAVEYSGAATTTLTGLSHLEGESVYVWGNGRQSGPHVVSGGQITIEYSVTYAIIGLLYTGKYKGSRLEWGASAGTALTQHKQIKKLGIMLSRTAGAAVQAGPSYTHMSTLEDRLEFGESFDSPLQLQTRDIEDRTFDADMEIDQRLHIKMPTAGPATVLGLVPTVQTNEG